MVIIINTIEINSKKMQKVTCTFRVFPDKGTRAFSNLKKRYYNTSEA